MAWGLHEQKTAENYYCQINGMKSFDEEKKMKTE
jgi:hypothetical protein